MLGRGDRLRREDGRTAPVHVLTPPPVVPTQWMEDGPAFRAALALNARIVGPRRCGRRCAELEMTDARRGDGVRAPARAAAGGTRSASARASTTATTRSPPRRGSASTAPRLEAEYLGLADAVVVTSEGLRDEPPSSTPTSTSSPTASTSTCSTRPPALAQSESARPCVGFIGSLDERVDYDLLRGRSSAQRPDLDFLFVGRATAPEAEALGGATRT